MHFRRKMSSLTALVALEATVRHRSISAAAREIGVTQAAVSRHIAALEEDFGRPLFIRAHRAVQPTAECMVLGHALSENFHGISDAIEAMRTTPKDMVTIGASVALSQLWLIPRLLRFRQDHPGLALRVASRDDRIDLATGEVDLVIRFGKGPFPDGEIIATAPELVFPVCSPEYAARHDLSRFPNCRFDLIEQDVPDRSWYRWSDWFAETGSTPPNAVPSLRFTYFTDTLAAARAGQGIAMGWHMLLGDALQTGALVKVGSRQIVPMMRNHLVVPPGKRAGWPVELVKRWLAAELVRDPAAG
ncbi:LysR substrate-binding domain-containing protein [Tabrizicola sp.]|uniref:LysR substrate-binding domain-containing protein n=1 Tax=Tabrizicola sp. TaxID=2005166 RepID=UPI002FDED3C6